MYNSSLFSPSRVRMAGAFGFVCLLAGCTCSEPTTDSELKAQPAEQASPPAAPSTPPVEQRPKGHPVPTGPRLVVVPGKGLSAIRFGTTVETLARHMAAPCDIQTEAKCIYVRQALEFDLKEGVVSGMKAHRRDRQVQGAPGDQFYGTFFGSALPEIMLGLHQHVVIEEFGEPQKREPLQGPDGQTERHFYDGVIFEYDKIENGNVVLSAIEVVPSLTAPPGPQK